MQTLELEDLCPECQVRLLDIGEEMVCPRCGIAKEKQVIAQFSGRQPTPMDAVRQSLGSYMGPMSGGPGFRTARGITGGRSGFKYLKTISDHAGRDEGPEVACAKIVERVGEHLHIPRPVVIDAASVARRVLADKPSLRKVTLASISAFSMISACRTAGVTSVSPREIVAAHAVLGKRVTSSSIFHLGFESKVKTYARRPDEYLQRVLAKLASDGPLMKRLADDRSNAEAYIAGLRECGGELLRLADRCQMMGKRPCALAASAVYSAESVLSVCENRQRRLSQKQVAPYGDTSEYTVREQCAMIFTPGVKLLISRRRQFHSSA